MESNTALSLYRYIVPDTSGIPLAPRIRTSPTVTEKSVRIAMDVWQSQETRFDRLYHHYVGLNHGNFVFDTGEPSDGQSRVVSNYFRYIVKTLRGYIIGNAPEYEYAEDDIYAQAITKYFHDIGMESVDADIIQDMAIYGRAYEVVYLDEDGQPKSSVISPRDCFVAYSPDFSEKPVFGCIRYAVPQDNRTDRYVLKVYTDTEIRTYESNNEDVAYHETEPPVLHGMGRVPIIEYANKDFIGDAEGILALENLYNRTLLNRVADKDAFVKAILLITGQVLGMTPDEIKASRKNLNDLRVLQLDDGAGASFLEHSMDESGIQILQDQIKSDIHKFSMIPDMSDEQFANNSSGVAMAFKLLGQDEVVRDKIANFQRSFRVRCRIYDYVFNNPARNPAYVPMADLGAMKVIFKLSVPQDLSYMASALTQLTGAGIISKDTARQNLIIVADSDIEKDKVEKEAENDAQKMRMAFESDYTESEYTDEQ